MGARVRNVGYGYEGRLDAGGLEWRVRGRSGGGGWREQCEGLSGGELWG